ncbi:MAG: hypothetical protein ACUZ8H_00185 [Candidatus Anammoxibacter sp.]
MEQKVKRLIEEIEGKVAEIQLGQIDKDSGLLDVIELTQNIEFAVSERR